MNEILITLLVSLGHFNGYTTVESKEEPKEESVIEKRVTEHYYRSVIYLDIEQASSINIIEQEDKDEYFQTITK